jgi:two-component system sensor histidine kinase BaeS
MRRSLLARLLRLSLTGAAVAAVSTALLVTYGTGPELQNEAAADASQLQTDSEILTALSGYASEHDSWSGVEPVLRDLAQRTGRRIALATPDARTIADTARLLGQPDTALPSRPVATIDAAAGTARRTLLAQRGSAAPPPEPALLVDGWRLDDDEKAARTALASAAADCLRDNVAGSAGPRALVHASPPDLTGSAVPPLTHPCVPPALFAPSAQTLHLNALVVDAAIGCLTDRGVAHTVGTDPLGMRTLMPAPEVRPEDWTSCLESARTEVLRPIVAPVALLYLGTSDRFDPFSPDGWWRTGLTVVVVLAAVAAVTVLTGRRLVAPIGALTTVALRMAEGDRRVRALPRGDSEVIRLAGAFNSMAEAIERAEMQRTAMANDVAHELRTPLANVRSQLEAAEDGLVPLDTALLRALQMECSLLARLVDDLQDLALADAGMLRVHLEERDAADLARQAVAAHGATAEAANVTVRLTAADPVPVLADPARLRQTLGNLVANAVSHTPNGGTVEVAVCGAPDAVVITVADTGSGIAAEHLPHVFDRFYRADPSRDRSTGGSGLGLAITRHLVEAHGGTVGLTSTVGAGTVVTVRLPPATLTKTSSTRSRPTLKSLSRSKST